MYATNDGWTESALYQNYDGLRQRAKLGCLLGYLTGRPRTLRSLSQAMQGCRIAGQRNEGLKLVLLKRIVGSEGRSRDYDRAYRPLTGSTRQRWVNIALAHLQGVGLPPVELIQIGEAYFVRDGHHRISVARALGETCIDAEVTLWEVAEPATASARRPAQATA